MAAEALQPFIIVRKTFKTVGFYPPQLNQFQPFNWRNLLFISGELTMCISTFTFLIFKADNVQDFGTSFYTTMTVLAIIFSFLSLIFKMQNIFEIIGKIEGIIGKRLNNRISKTMYYDVNRKIELMSKIMYFIFVQLVVPGFMCPAIIVAMVNYYVYDLNDESFTLPTPATFPFNWKTPFGYLIALIIETLGVYWVQFVLVPIGCFLIGSCWFVMAFVDDIINDISILNGYGKRMRNAWKVEQQFHFIVQNIAEVQQLMGHINSVYQFAVTVLFTWSLTTTGVLIFLIDKQLMDGGSEPNEIIATAIALVSASVCLFAICMFGENLANQFDELDDKISQCAWYLFPIYIKRMLIIVMSNTQREILMLGYGNIACTRDTFKRISQKVFSYFMALRQIAE